MKMYIITKKYKNGNSTTAFFKSDMTLDQVDVKYRPDPESDDPKEVWCAVNLVSMSIKEVTCE
jgi:hypothetical protein